MTKSASTQNTALLLPWTVVFFILLFHVNIPCRSISSLIVTCTSVVDQLLYCLWKTLVVEAHNTFYLFDWCVCYSDLSWLVAIEIRNTVSELKSQSSKHVYPLGKYPVEQWNMWACLSVTVCTYIVSITIWPTDRLTVWLINRPRPSHPLIHQPTLLPCLLCDKLDIIQHNIFTTASQSSCSISLVTIWKVGAADGNWVGLCNCTSTSDISH